MTAFDATAFDSIKNHNSSSFIVCCQAAKDSEPIKEGFLFRFNCALAPDVRLHKEPDWRPSVFYMFNWSHLTSAQTSLTEGNFEQE